MHEEIPVLFSDCVVSVSSIKSMAGITVDSVGLPREKNNVASLKI
jgi:hypothetical protein